MLRIFTAQECKLQSQPLHRFFLHLEFPPPAGKLPSLALDSLLVQDCRSAGNFTKLRASLAGDVRVSNIRSCSSQDQGESTKKES
mmetsp:Transcript_115092/g.199722  ORF Transcript_115092/g.199722 Transcript_115092/m.199722 type:complete len:85 (+) Transcript_115092:173-427(+)